MRETAEAVRAAGLQFGLYVSPWDLHESRWGSPSYNDFFVAQLYELTSRNSNDYGPLFEVWFDGAHGDEVTQEQRDTYDGARWLREIRFNQPGAVLALDIDVFWSGNEDGLAPETYWSFRDGMWTPIECNMPLREGWFWREDDEPKPLSELVDAYFRTVGRNCVFLIGLAPDTRGLLPEEDVERLIQWRSVLDGIFEFDLAKGARASASSTRSGHEGWSPGAAADGNSDSFWAADDDKAWLQVDLGRRQAVNVIELSEPIRYGQRVGAFHVEAWDGASWNRVASGTTIGHKRLIRIDPHTAQRWRVVIEETRAAPAISRFGLYFAPQIEEYGP